MYLTTWSKSNVYEGDSTPLLNYLWCFRLIKSSLSRQKKTRPHRWMSVKNLFMDHIDTNINTEWQRSNVSAVKVCLVSLNLLLRLQATIIHFIFIITSQLSLLLKWKCDSLGVAFSFKTNPKRTSLLGPEIHGLQSCKTFSKFWHFFKIDAF